MKTVYRVYFEQINACIVEVAAESRETAIAKATKIARPKIEDMHVGGVEVIRRKKGVERKGAR